MSSQGYVYWVGGSTPETRNAWKFKDPNASAGPYVDPTKPYGGLDNINSAIKDFAPQAQLATSEQADTLGPLEGTLGVTVNACSKMKGQPEFLEGSLAGGDPVCAGQEDAGLWVYSPTKILLSQKHALERASGGGITAVGDFEDDESKIKGNLLAILIFIAVAFALFYFMYYKKK